MTTTGSAGIHVDPAEISHSYHPGDDKCPEYGTLDLGRPGHNCWSYIFFDGAGMIAAIDKAIAELVALKQEMAPPVTACPSVAPFIGRPCTETGGHEFHRSGMVTWTDKDAAPAVAGSEPVAVTGAPLCDSELPLKHGGVLKCTTDAGHYGMHSAVNGNYRWLGHGADARDEQGDKIAPVSVTA